MQPPGVWAPVCCHWLNELLRLRPALLLPIIAVPRNATMGHWLQLIHKGARWVTHTVPVVPSADLWFQNLLFSFQPTGFPDVTSLILNMKSLVEWRAPMIDPSVTPETVSPRRGPFVLFEGTCLIEQVSLKKKKKVIELFSTFSLCLCFFSKTTEQCSQFP